MTETLHLKDCPVCSSRISITHDRVDDTLTLRPENLPPLARDCLDVVSTYKRVKGLGADWQRHHGSRGIIYAANVLNAVGTHGGQIDRALGLIAWLGDQKGRDWDLGSAANFFGEYQAWAAAKSSAERSRCAVCGEGFWGKGVDCGRH